ncbi:MAG: glycosyltransferase family 1 protein [Bacteroidetes bacterium]|jgi:glycosyltransferase involved in cell wall biosynthesis|nr:glycosyltransferase family 1 protein [Bacteroidota bacterium]
MRIAIEGQRLFRLKKHGMDMVALELVKKLQLIDRENEYVIFVKPDEDDQCIPKAANFKIVPLAGGAYPLWEQRALPKAVKEYGCDLLHCTSNTAPLNSPVPLIVTLHDIIYLESVSIFKKGGTWYQKFGNMYRRFVVPKVVEKSDKIITVSHFEKNRIKTFFGFPESDNRLVAIYNGVSEHFKPISDQEVLDRVRKQYQLPPRFVFFLGNTDPKKNTKGVLKAFSDYLKAGHKALKLVMLDYDREALEKLLIEIGDRDLINHIHLTGYVVNSDLPAIYSMSELFLYPSLRESFGIPMLEAMRCGVPVITSNTSSMPEVADDAALFVDPYKPEQITAAMTKMLHDQTIRKEYIEKGLKRAADFTWKSMAEDVLKLYQEVADNHHS